MSQISKLNLTSIAVIAGLIGSTACTSSGGPSAGPLSPAVPASSPPAIEPNPNITVLSSSSPGAGARRDQTFDVAGSFLSVRENAAGGFDLLGSSQTTFNDTAGTVFYDRSTRSLTFDIAQGSVDIEETFGPILLFEPPEDLLGFVNDTLAVTISSVPETFIGILPGNVILPNGAQTLNDLRNDPGAVDFLIEDLRRLGSGDPSLLGTELDADTATAILESLNTVTEAVYTSDFIRHIGENGSRFSPLNIRDNNPGIEPSYVVLGIWRTSPVDALPSDTTFGSTVFGLLTPPEEVPTTGSATYDTTISGYVLRNADVTFLTGTVNLTADFATRGVSFDVQSTLATSDTDGMTLFTPFVDLEGNGLLTGGNRFSGNLIGTNDVSLRGDVDGAFFGPGAVEVGGTLRFGNDELQAAGSFVGTRQGDTN